MDLLKEMQARLAYQGLAAFISIIRPGKAHLQRKSLGSEVFASQYGMGMNQSWIHIQEEPTAISPMQPW